MGQLASKESGSPCNLATATGPEQFIEAPFSTKCHPKLSGSKVTLESNTKCFLKSTEMSGHAARRQQGKQQGPG